MKLNHSSNKRTTRAIARELNEREVPLPGLGPWHAMTVNPGATTSKGRPVGVGAGRPSKRMGAPLPPLLDDKKPSPGLRGGDGSSVASTDSVLGRDR